MPVLVQDPDDAQKLIEQRRQWGADKWDEVWDGVYVMATLPNHEHQELVSDLNSILREGAKVHHHHRWRGHLSRAHHHRWLLRKERLRPV